MTAVRFLIRSRDSSLFTGHAQSPMQWITEPPPPRVKQHGSNSDYWLPSIAEVKKCGAIPPFYHSLHGIILKSLIKHRDLTSTFTLPYNGNKKLCLKTVYSTFLPWLSSVLHSNVGFVTTSKPLFLTISQAWWTPKPVWMIYRRVNSWSYRNSKSDLSGIQPVLRTVNKRQNFIPGCLYPE